MELIKGLDALRPEHRGGAATIGNFDGVHLGHQAMLAQVKDAALTHQLSSLVICFEPHPQEFFCQQDPPARLSTLNEKVEAFEASGIDRVLCLKFDQKLATITAEHFIQQILVDAIAVKYLVVGDDFRFGHQRTGSFETLKSASFAAGFGVLQAKTLEYDGQRVSSTRVREALMQGDCQQAWQLLGRPYRMSGEVMRGDQRGRTLGFPTANLPLNRQKSPISGVFAVRVKIGGIDVQSKPLFGVANVGKRPTVGGQEERLEVHCLNFDGDLYQSTLSVEFLCKIRGEKRFDDLAALKHQIREDILTAQHFFDEHLL